MHSIHLTAPDRRQPDPETPLPSAQLERRVGLAVWALLAGVVLLLGSS